MAQPWPPIPLFGRPWAPASPATWLLPAVSIGAGGVFLLLARHTLAAVERRDESTTSVLGASAKVAQ
jgi:branched-chain amino acid transport system permease protein